MRLVIVSGARDFCLPSSIFTCFEPWFALDNVTSARLVKRQIENDLIKVSCNEEMTDHWYVPLRRKMTAYNLTMPNAVPISTASLYQEIKKILCGLSLMVSYIRSAKNSILSFMFCSFILADLFNNGSSISSRGSWSNPWASLRHWEPDIIPSCSSWWWSSTAGSTSLSV